MQIAILLLLLIFSKFHSKSRDYLYFKRCVVLEVGIFFSLELMLCFALLPDKESSQSKRLLFSQNLNFIHKKLVPFDVNSFYFLLVEKLLIEYPMVVRDCIHQWRKRLVIAKLTKNGLQIVTGKKNLLHSNEGLNIYLHWIMGLNKFSHLV